MLARRFALPPVHEAKYEPRQIPNALCDMSGTAIIRPPRELWLTLLGEMVQMVNEAVRRRASCARDASKPLSLEYMADRLDIDEPLVGYLAVTRAEGWLQGFVTYTTFTTWHRDFRWDSLNPVLDLHHPHGELSGDDTSGASAQQPALLVDEDGALAVELQAQLHAGDPDSEGIVWPRIAELSLLGALGCGRQLVELVIANCEAEDSPYEFLVVQATDGSIPFYERMGFRRVGAVTVRRRAREEDADAEWQPKPKTGAKRKLAAAAARAEPVLSPHTVYRVEGSNETVSDVAGRLDLPVFDLMFFNTPRLPGLHPDAVLKKGTKLLVPELVSLDEVRAESAATHHEWHALTEDMSFKECARELGIDPRELIGRQAGRPELKGLQVGVVRATVWGGCWFVCVSGLEGGEEVRWRRQAGRPELKGLQVGAGFFGGCCAPRKD
jgi:GNAT superfamily N-acetyltransferase